MDGKEETAADKSDGKATEDKEKAMLGFVGDV